MKEIPIDFGPVRLFEPSFQFSDHRGEMVCMYGEEWEDVGFLKWNLSRSHRGVLRGIHMSPSAAKLATCLYGRIYAVVVDCRRPHERDTGAFGEWRAFELTDGNRRMVLVPPMYGLAHFVLSEWALFSYHWSEGFDGDAQTTFAYDDPTFRIKWPEFGEGEPILSERDRGAKSQE